MIRRPLTMTTAVLVFAALTAGCASEASSDPMTNEPTVRVISAMGMKSVLDEVADAFQKESGTRLDLEYDTAGLVTDRVSQGEEADVVLTPRPYLDELTDQDLVIGESITDLSRSVIGIAARSGTPSADISTPQALKELLLNAESLSYTDPAAGGLSGTQFAVVIDALGIADELEDKTSLGTPMDRVESGEVEYAIIQMSEINSLEDVEIIGELPDQYQVKTPFSAAVVKNSAMTDESSELLSFLTSSEVADVLRESGMVPINE